MKQALHISVHRFTTPHNQVGEDSPIPILLDGNGNFGLDDGINTSDLVSNLPGAFEQQWVLY